MQCEDLAELLTDLLEGDVDAEQEAAALEHLASCEQCERVLADTRDAIDLTRRHGRITLDDDARQRTLAEVTSQLG